MIFTKIVILLLIINYSADLLKLDGLDVRKDKINKVKKNEIIRLSKKIKIDTIFNLEGVLTDED